MAQSYVGGVSDELRTELEQRNLEHGMEFHIQVSEAEALDLASGVVPLTVQSMAQTMLNWIDLDRRNRERPYRKRKAK